MEDNLQRFDVVQQHLKDFRESHNKMNQVFQHSLDEFARNFEVSFNQLEDQICEIQQERAIQEEQHAVTVEEKMQEPANSNYFQEERAQKDKIVGPSIQSKALNSSAPESIQSTLSTLDTRGRIPSKEPRLVWHPPWPGCVTHSLTAQKLHKSCASLPHSLICVGQRTLGSSQLRNPSASSGSILFWSWSKPHVEVKSCPAKPIKPLVANHEGTYIVGGGLSGDIYLWEVASGRHAHYRVVTCLKFSNNDSLLRILTKKRKGFDDAKDGNLEENGGYLSGGKWGYLRKDCFNQTSEKLTACDYHRGLNMMVVGFSNGVFGLYQLLDFVCIHLLSIPREKITTAVFNETRNCLMHELVVEWKLGYGVCHRQRMEGEHSNCSLGTTSPRLYLPKGFRVKRT